jgi:hypothetical protein
MNLYIGIVISRNIFLEKLAIFRVGEPDIKKLAESFYNIEPNYKGLTEEIYLNVAINSFIEIFPGFIIVLNKEHNCAFLGYRIRMEEIFLVSDIDRIISNYYTQERQNKLAELLKDLDLHRYEIKIFISEPLLGKNFTSVSSELRKL